MTNMDPFWKALVAGLNNDNYAGNISLGIPIYLILLLLLLVFL